MSHAPDRNVNPGGCYLQNELVHCALDEFHCQGLQFRSARQMRESEDPAAEHCHRPHPDYVGMCTSTIDNFHCTGHESGCIITSKFVPNVPYCTVQYNHFPDRDTHLTLYGSCTHAGQKTCVWSMNDCPGAGDDMMYEPASSVSYGNADLCTCDKVQTGACIYGENTSDEIWTCAVSADACDKDSAYRPWQEVLARGRDCRLCPEAEKTASQISKGRVHRFGPRGGPHGGQLRMEVALGVIIAVFLLLNLIVGLWCRRCGRRNAASALENNKVESLDNVLAIEEHDHPVIT